MLKKIQRKKRIKLAQGKPNIKVGSFWIKNVIYIFVAFVFAVFLSYKIFDGSSTFDYLLKIKDQNSQIVELTDQFDKLNLEIELLEISLNKKDEDLQKLEEKNNDLQEEILFYEKIVGKRR